MGSDVDGLPPDELPGPLPDVEDPEAFVPVRFGHPLLRLWHFVAARAHLLVERYRRAVLQHGNQFSFVPGHVHLGLDLEDGEREDLGVLASEGRVLPLDHLQEVGDDARTGVELDVRGEDVVRGGRLPGDVPPHVDRVQDLLQALVHRRRVHVGVRWRQRAVVRLREERVLLRDHLRQML